MGESFDISALGCRVAIDVGGVGVSSAANARDAWRDAIADPDNGESTSTVSLSGGVSLVHAMSRLSTDVTLAALGAQRGAMWMLHAAALALDDGRTVSLVGPSGRGKTTASRALGAHFAYVSDETTAIMPDGTVLPYRKPLSIIEADGEVKVQRAPSDLGLRLLPDAPLRLARVVLLDRQADGPSRPVVSEVSLGDALAALVEQTSYLADLPRPLATIASHIEATGGIVRLTYREAESLPPILSALAVDSPRAPLVSPAAAASAVAAGPDDGSPRIHRVPAFDELVLDGGARLAVLQPSDTLGGATLRLLDGIGPTIWACGDGASLAAVTAAVVSEHGHPPRGDAEELVRAAINELRDEGVLADI